MRPVRPARFAHRGSFTLGVVCTLLALVPVQAQGAVAQGRVVAEVMNPAALDTASLLEAVLAGATRRGGAGQTAPQVQPEVRLLSIQGVTWLNIDYD